MKAPLVAGAAEVGLPDARRLRYRAWLAQFRSGVRELWMDKTAVFGASIVVVLVVVAIAAPLIAPYDPSAQSLGDRLMPPVWLGGGWTHPLGTDHLGRDVLSRTIFGARISLIIGVSVVLVSGVFGTVLALVCGYIGGLADSFVMRWIDVQVAFPELLLALLILTVLRPSPWTIVVALGINGWMVYARVVRGLVLSIKQTPYVEAAEVIGCSPLRVIFLHILPNLMSPLTTLAVLEFARVILAEAALSFLGLGIQPPATSWGLDVATGKNYLFSAWWLVTVPGAAIVITVLGVNLLASWLRIVNDPQEREKQYARLIFSRTRP